MEVKNKAAFSQESLHSSCIFLVFNIPEESWANSAQKEIIQGVTEKWRREESDPEAKRIHIIYMNADEFSESPSEASDKKNTPQSGKYEAFNHLDHRSLICIVGHCSPGSENIYTDRVFNDYDPATFYSKPFHFTDIGNFLLTHITNPEVRFNMKQSEVADWSLNALNQRLRIAIPSCHSGSKVADENDSFSARLYQHLTSGGTVGKEKYFLKCNVIGAKAKVAPIPTEPSFFEACKFLGRAYFPDVFSKSPDEISSNFHLRYVGVEKSMFTFFPHHNPEELDYSMMVTSVQVQEPSFTKGEPPVELPATKMYSTKELNEKLLNEVLCERWLAICSDIKANLEHVGDLSTKEIGELQAAIKIEIDITNGKFPQKQMLKVLSDYPVILPKSGPSFF